MQTVRPAQGVDPIARGSGLEGVSEAGACPARTRAGDGEVRREPGGPLAQLPTDLFDRVSSHLDVGSRARLRAAHTELRERVDLSQRTTADFAAYPPPTLPPTPPETWPETSLVWLLAVADFYLVATLHDLVLAWSESFVGRGGLAITRQIMATSSVYITMQSCREILSLRRTAAARRHLPTPVPGELGQAALRRLRGGSSLSCREARTLKLRVAEDTWRLHAAFSAGARQAAGWVETKDFSALNAWLSTAPAAPLAAELVAPDIVTAMLSLAWTWTPELDSGEDIFGLSTLEVQRKLLAAVARLRVMPDPDSPGGQHLAMVARQSLSEMFRGGVWNYESPMAMEALELQVGLCGTWTPSFSWHPEKLWAVTVTRKTLILRLNRAADPTEPGRAGAEAQASAGLVPEARDAFPALCALVTRLEHRGLAPPAGWAPGV